MHCLATSGPMITEWGFHAIFIPDFLLLGLLFDFLLPLPPPPCLWLHSTCAWAWQQTCKIPSARQAQKERKCTFYFSILLLRLLWLLMLAEGLGLAVSICWNNLPDSSYLWTLPAEQTSQSTCFPLNPHLSQQLIPSSQTCPPNSHPLLKFVRGNFKWDMPFSRWGSGFHCSSLSFYKCSLCKDLFLEAGNLIIKNVWTRPMAVSWIFHIGNEI